MSANEKPMDGYKLKLAASWSGTARISIALAAKWLLSQNLRNRRVRGKLVEFLANHIRTGEWQSDHPQPVVFADNERLIDGQHRLMGLVLALATDLKTLPNSKAWEDVLQKTAARTGNLPHLDMRIQTGAREKLREYIDTGISRTMEDRIEFDPDLQLNRSISQLVACSYYVKMGTTLRPTADDAWEIFKFSEEAIRFAAEIMRRKRERGVVRAPVFTALVQLYVKNKDKATRVFRSTSNAGVAVTSSRNS